MSKPRTTRKRANNASTAVVVEDLGNVECLLLAQAVWQYGQTAWETIAALLSGHPLFSHKMPAISAASCEIIYKNLMSNAGLAIPQDNSGGAEVHDRLARIFWNARSKELRDALEIEETKYKKLLAEVQEIRLREQQSNSQDYISNNERGMDDATSPEDDIPRRSTRRSTAATHPPASARRRQQTGDIEINEDQQSAEKRKASSDLAEDGRTPKRAREDSDQEEEEEEDEEDEEEVRRRKKRFTSSITTLHNQISEHVHGGVFQNPIKRSEAPDYHDIVKEPMDLRTIRNKLKDKITTAEQYQRDVYLMFANAMMYNRPGSQVYMMTKNIMHDSEIFIQSHLNASYNASS